ncbi:MAG TPA: glutamyl-tRNA reductase [Ktedonobacterales bacterium]|nr:glutamyl-tRNA reductase [Ktedonobacterales bacterium]
MIGLLGLDYRGTSAEFRGRLTFAGDRLHAALRALVDEAAIEEVIIVSTCNRTEVYVATEDWAAASSSIARLLSEAFRRGASAIVTSISAGEQHAQASEPGSAGRSTGGNIGRQAAGGYVALLPDELASALYEFQGAEAARHLFGVSAGLKSMVLGEVQILGQVREALAAAEAVHTAGEELRTLFNMALKAGKRARAETEIGRADVSVASLAVRVAGESLGGLTDKSALIVGAGRTSQLCARLLHEAGVQRLVLANRTVAAADELAQTVGGEAVTLANIADIIPDVQLIVSATAAPYLVLSAATVARGMAGRRTPLVIVDLAVPPDVEEDAGLLPAVSLHTLDTLRGLDGDGQVLSAGKRDTELARIGEIVEEGVRDYLRARTVRRAVPSIAALRRHVDRSEQAELARALAQLHELSAADRAVIERFGQRLVGKMFHHLVSRIRSLAEYDEVPPEVTMQVLMRLFADPDDAREADD